jgi:lipopolysaccharide/colanic/teichoic acid biosynthesis glycosyltransferase
MVKIHPYYYSRTKRVFDLLVSILLLISLSPLILATGLLVFFTAGSPIIFKQKRLGKNGKIFIILKFRTMEKNASLTKYKYSNLNEAPEPMFKIHNDPRFVGLGKFLSKSGFDELPQLINIIKGEMSLVGPRPLPVKEAKALPKNWREFRENVKPGIFSYWALSNSKHKDGKQWEKLELKTVTKGSPTQDLRLIANTIKSQLILTFKNK